MTSKCAKDCCYNIIIEFELTWKEGQRVCVCMHAYMHACDCSPSPSPSPTSPIPSPSPCVCICICICVWVPGGIVVRPWAHNRKVVSSSLAHAPVEMWF